MRGLSRMAAVAAGLLAAAGLAVLLWPLVGSDLRATAAYPNHEHLAACPPGTPSCYEVRELVPAGLERPPTIYDVVRSRREVAAVLLVGALVVSATDVASRRRPDLGDC